ncbi:MAG TPA: serine/threonine-protein kinase [Polyangiaceae bacterium]|nr:serine/threonine-protein kinase [Polyangiaceae bacterium]
MAKQDTFDWVGRVIDGKYRVDRAVDEGTFGVVYQAHHLKFDEKVALKCLKLPKGLQGPMLEEFCRRFVAEGRFLHRLSRTNVNIVQALDVGAELAPGGGWVPYLVLEWLEGVSLAEDLEQRAARGEGGRGLEAAIGLLEPAALALAAAHEQRVLHCDVKPANLFLTEVAGRPTLKVLDFGIAKFADEQAGRDLGEGGSEALCAFSPFYAAPEQFDRDRGPTGPWTDVYSLALVLLEVASGRPARDGQSLAQLFQAAVDDGRGPGPRALGVVCPDAVDEVVLRALSPRPEARYATAFAFWRALTEAAGLGAPKPLEAAHSSPSLRRLAGADPELRVSPEGDDAPAEGAAASTGAHPASDESPPPPQAAPAAAEAPRRARKLGSLVALASGAVLALTATYRGPLPGLSAASGAPPAGLVPLGSRLESSAMAGLVSPVLSRLDAALPDGTLAALTSGLRSAGAAPEATRPAGAPEATRPAGAPARAAGPEVEGAGDFTLRTLGREALLDYVGAARECAKTGMALCTETQWQLACDANSPVGASESWLASPERSAGAIVRGGSAGCGARQTRPVTKALRTGGQACCAPALVGDLHPQFTPASLPTPVR